MNYVTRKLLTSSIRRAIRWEFWPIPVLYIPVVVYIAWLSLRYRGLTFLSCNPGLPMSGLLGERKADTLIQLQNNIPESVATFELIAADQTQQEKRQQAKGFMQRHGLLFPIVLKPNFGDRGLGVSVIYDDQSLQDYLEQATADTIIQQHVSGEEFGIFYLRYPQQANGEIFSIAEKTFPKLTGDGSSTLQRLILDNPRTHYMARYLLELHKDKLQEVLPEGEVFQTVEIGTHSRGSLFLEGGHHLTEELTASIDHISKNINEVYFGRYDVRAPSVEDLHAGLNIKVMELNGVSSEAASMYDPKYSVLYAYKVLFRQWRAAFEIGNQNIQRDAKKVPIKNLLAHLKAAYGS